MKYCHLLIRQMEVARDPQKCFKNMAESWSIPRPCPLLFQTDFSQRTSLSRRATLLLCWIVVEDGGRPRRKTASVSSLQITSLSSWKRVSNPISLQSKTIKSPWKRTKSLKWWNGTRNDVWWGMWRKRLAQFQRTNWNSLKAKVKAKQQ